MNFMIVAPFGVQHSIVFEVWRLASLALKVEISGTKCLYGHCPGLARGRRGVGRRPSRSGSRACFVPRGLGFSIQAVVSPFVRCRRAALGPRGPFAFAKDAF
jgi:hypothetical protein